MFRGLSSWFGLQQPETGDRQSEEDGQPEGDGQPKGDTAPEQRSEAVAEPAEGASQQAEDQELLHQAKGLGSESPRDQTLSGSVRNLPFDTPGARAWLIEGCGGGGR